MIEYVIRRLIVSVPMLLVVTLLVFFLMSLAPGDFLDTARMQRDISEETIHRLEQEYGLDKPWHVQYGRWLGKAAAGDFGYSWTYKVSVSELLAQRAPATLGLAAGSLALAWLIALPLGVLAAIYKGSWLDRFVSLAAYAAISLPDFFIALIALFFASVSGMFPVGGLTSITSDFFPPGQKFADYLWHLALPVLVLGLGGVAGTLRVMRANFLDQIRAEYVTTARAKGLSEFVVMFKHALRNAVNPFITSLGFAFSGLLSGALIVENIFNYPGLGQLTFNAFLRQDKQLVLASVVLGTTMLIIGNLLADIFLALSDPRIRLGGGGPAFRRRQIWSWLGVAALTVTVCYALRFMPWESGDFWRQLKLAGALMLAGAGVFVIYAAWPVLRQIVPRLARRPLGAVTLSVLALLYGCSLLAPFLAPYSSSDQDLTKTFHPPTAPVWKDGALRMRTYRNVDRSIARYEPVADGEVPVRFFTKGAPYKLLGVIPLRTRLVGVDAPHKLYLMGSDSTGRDVFSRLLYGSQVSLTLGLIGVTITMSLGFLIGALSGYLGGSFDNIVMRLTEIIMCIPGLYLLIALRFALYKFFDSSEMFVLIVVVLSFIGWTGTARVIRGMTLSVRQRAFILAAETMGQSRLKILFKHILPNIASYLVISATMAIPGYILGEASLSFLGLGIMEPSASWGLMLSQAQEMKVFMLGFAWLFIPGLLMFIVVLTFNLLGDELRDLIDPKFKTENRL
ncbi:MAG: ABC transporter permease subunit [Verrucomicrobiales bacterium]|jgi:peptide/nickel transport system permease protein|nr:ABC transporter permease subunit [Verrucomicrobiales bacterium]